MNKNNPDITSSQTEEKLFRLYRSFAAKRRSTVLLWAIFILIAGITAITLTEQVFYFDSLTKTILVLVCVFVAIYNVWQGFRETKSQSFEQFYRTFSRQSNLPELKDVLDLEKNHSGNKALVDAAILQNLSRLKPERLQKMLEEYTSKSFIQKRFKKSLLFSVSAILIGGATALNFDDAFNRTLTFWKNYEKPNPFIFTIEPENATLEQGSPFQATVRFLQGELPKNVHLQIKTAVEENYRSLGMEFSNGSFQSIPFDLNQNLQYFIKMDEYRSRVYIAEVQLRPRFSELHATVIPPAYTHLDSTNLSYPFSRIHAYEGSNVILSGNVNKPLDFLKINKSDSSQFLDVQSDSSITYHMKITGEDTLQFSMADKSGLINKNKFQIVIFPEKDEYPLVEIIEPKSSYEEVNPTEIRLFYRASDDFELTGASLHYELSRAFTDEPHTGKISLPKPGNSTLQPFIWNPDSLELKPKDELTFWIRVQDNDAYNGYKSSQSEAITLTVPSLVDYFDDLGEKEEEINSELEDVSESFREMQNQYDQFKEKMRENPDDVGYEQKQELEQVKKLQEEVRKQIEKLNKKFEKIKEEIDENEVLSEETQQAYEELKKLMEEVDDPAFMKMLEEMRDQLGELNPEQLREAMEKFEFNEELYKERLERTIELFKQLKLNSDLDKLIKAYEDLARKEKELEKNKPSAEELRQHREQSIEENKKLRQKVDSLSKNTSEKNKRAISEYQKKAQKKLEEVLEQLKKELESDNQQKQNQPGPKESYEELAKMTQALMEGMNRKQTQINIAGLKYVLQSLLALSIEQEDLTSLASKTETQSQAFVDFAREQRNVEEIFAAISDSLYKLSADSPQFSNEINKRKMEVAKQLSRSLEQMAERNQSQSSVASRQALGGINDISFMIVNLLEQLESSQNGGGGGGGMSTQQMMEQLQQTGGQQQRLNQQLQQMINDIQGERLSQNQMQRLNEMAKTQNRIRKQLQQIQQNGNGGDKIGSQLERMIEEMENTINDLRGGAADPLMIKRQKNILSRMLEAEKALQERGEKEEREGTTAEEFDRITPPELTLEELEKQIRNRLNDPDFTEYSADYQRLIEKYFELLKDFQPGEIQ